MYYYSNSLFERWGGLQGNETWVWWTAVLGSAAMESFYILTTTNVLAVVLMTFSPNVTMKIILSPVVGNGDGGVGEEWFELA